MAPEECLRLSSGLDIYTCKQCALSYDIPTLTQICMKADSGRKMPGETIPVHRLFTVAAAEEAFQLFCVDRKWIMKGLSTWNTENEWHKLIIIHVYVSTTPHTILHTPYPSTHTIPPTITTTPHTPYPPPHHCHHPTLPTHTELESDQGRCNKGKCNSTVFCSLFFPPTFLEDHLELYQELGAHGTVQNRMLSETECLGVSMVVL